MLGSASWENAVGRQGGELNVPLTGMRSARPAFIRPEAVLDAHGGLLLSSLRANFNASAAVVLKKVAVCMSVELSQVQQKAISMISTLSNCGFSLRFVLALHYYLDGPVLPSGATSSCPWDLCTRPDVLGGTWASLFLLNPQGGAEENNPSA